MKLSIVSPVYRAEEILVELVTRVSFEAKNITNNFEIILVEDSSPDNSWSVINSICINNQNVKGIKLSRNFGQHFAITAGLENASGDVVIVMDCDLQDDPKYFKDLICKIQEGYNIVYTTKISRKHSWIKNISARFFYRIFNYLVDNKNYRASDSVGSFSALSRKAIDAFISYGDYRRHYLMVLRWLGFQHTYVVVEHNERYSGMSSYNWRKLLEHAIDGITSQSDKLLKITAGLGLALSSISFISIICILIRYLIKPFQAGWSSLFVLILFMSGLIILSIGICGIYIGKIFEQTKGRPKYIIEEFLNKN
jgi:glycosyltransferase involved in cell wall biosynthesis